MPILHRIRRPHRPNAVHALQCYGASSTVWTQISQTRLAVKSLKSKCWGPKSSRLLEVWLESKSRTRVLQLWPIIKHYLEYDLMTHFSPIAEYRSISVLSSSELATLNSNVPQFYKFLWVKGICFKYEKY